MTLEEMFSECRAASCVVVSFRAFTRYNEAGNLDEKDCIGIKYACLTGDGDSIVVESPWFYVDDWVSDRNLIADTPADAIALWKASRRTVPG